MLNNEQLEVINTYVCKDFFYVERLFEYLNTHDIVGNEIFAYTNKTNDRNRSTSALLNEKWGFMPLSLERFVKRIPFYYYIPDLENNKVGDLDCYLRGIYINECSNVEVEELYLALEKALYVHKISIEDIMEYIIMQTGYVSKTDKFMQWVDYLDLCNTLKWTDKMPENFIYAYNKALQRVGKTPIVYEVKEMCVGEYFYREGDEIVFQGEFPCDQDGQPVMEWIGVNVKNPEKITCYNNKRELGYSRLSARLRPNTLIHVLNCYNQKEDEDTWYQIYAGPQLMDFDYSILKNRRIQLGYTQQNVADTIGTSVRTYQKWESGQTQPDGRNMLRLMNYLDIVDPQEFVYYI